ncbi:MAG: hypothetical protein DWC02_05220 [Candidatus Poseidoniales archaeon]|nr:MAG: hypothetical protein DWC02_05220 [Candidatus Poseidoniales archaeon]
MEQIQIAETFKKNNAATAAKFIMIMSVIFLMTFIISLFPVMITIIFLAAPALIMNIGWLMFAGSV